MNFSLIFPTRNRVDLLEDLFKSLADTTFDLKSIEVIPVIDDDDVVTHQIINKLKNILPESSVDFRSRPRSVMLNEDYINWAARNSKGKFVFVLNDDIIFKTKNWDKIAYDKLENYLKDKPDGIVYGLTDDGMDKLRINQKINYTGFPILSQSGIKALNYAMHPSYASWGSDIDLFRVYSGAERICDLKEILVFHVSRHTQSREIDEINNHVAKIHTIRNGSSDMIYDTAILKSVINGTERPPIPQRPIVPQNKYINVHSSRQKYSGPMLRYEQRINQMRKNKK